MLKKIIEAGYQVHISVDDNDNIVFHAYPRMGPGGVHVRKMYTSNIDWTLDILGTEVLNHPLPPMPKQATLC